MRLTARLMIALIFATMENHRMPRNVVMNFCTACSVLRSFMGGKRILFFFLLGTTILSAQGIKVTARFQPEVAKVGEEVSLVITVLNANANPTLPASALQIEGLRLLGPASSGRKMQSSGGSMTIISTVTYSFLVEKEGSYTLPSFTITLDGNDYRTEPATLTVDGSLQDSLGMKEDDLILQYVLPEKIYAGQMFPVELQLLVKEGVEIRLQEKPVVEGAGFTQPTLPDGVDPGRARANGVMYDVYRMPFFMTALQSGEQPLRFSWQVMRVVENSSRRQGMGLFDQMFDSRRMIPVSVTPKKDIVEVLPLPQENRPASFDGAIGLFSISQEAVSPQAQVGQALSMKVKITGTGNFPGVPAPQLGKVDGWRVYEPQSEFVDADGSPDNFGYEGAKTFTYLLVPENERVSEVPSVKFAFFSPEDGEYIDTEIPSVPVVVAPAAASSAPATVVEPAPSATPIKTVPATAQKRTAPQIILYETENWLPTQFLLYTPVYWQVNGAIFIGMIGLGATLWITRRRQNDPLYQKKKAASQKIKFYKTQATRALQDDELERVCSLMRLAISERLTLEDEREALSLTFLEAEELLTKNNTFSAKEKDILREALATAEKFRYSSQKENTSRDQIQTLHDHVWAIIA